jgi:hypothetical protein
MQPARPARVCGAEQNTATSIPDGMNARSWLKASTATWKELAPRDHRERRLNQTDLATLSGVHRRRAGSTIEYLSLSHKGSARHWRVDRAAVAIMVCAAELPSPAA